VPRESSTATQRRQRRLTPPEYIDGILNGDRVALARAITVIESGLPDDLNLATRILEAILPYTGRARRVGISGVPGVGKSTFIDGLGLHLIRERNERLAVLTVDPSSPVSGGSILGDKTRMEHLALEERAFIRPSPTRGYLGGVAPRTRETMLLCEAAGYENIFVETVGVGQSEAAVRSMTDFFLLLVLAGAGDELQGIKRGIMEMIDAVAVNKADSGNERGAARARVEYASALRLFPSGPDGWKPPVLTCSALTGAGIPTIWDTVLEHRHHMESGGWLAERRSRQALLWMRELIELGLQDMFRGDPGVAAALPRLEEQVRRGEATPFAAACTLLSQFRSTE
jgi:LAO/AO transport system kinase